MEAKPHIVTVEAPNAVNDALEAFLNALEGLISPKSLSLQEPLRCKRDAQSFSPSPVFSVIARLDS
jgi:hypothetical protein